MKRLLFIALVLTTAVAGMAPLSRVAAQEAVQVESKLLFSSRIGEIDAFISRSRPEEARKVFNELAAMMQKYIGDSKNAQASTLYTETKILSADMAKNREAMIAKLREFLALM